MTQGILFLFVCFIFFSSKAIRSLKECKEEIKNGQDAIKLNGIGPTIAEKLDKALQQYYEQQQRLRSSSGYDGVGISRGTLPSNGLYRGPEEEEVIECNYSGYILDSCTYLLILFSFNLVNFYFILYYFILFLLFCLSFFCDVIT